MDGVKLALSSSMNKLKIYPYIVCFCLSLVSPALLAAQKTNVHPLEDIESAVKNFIIEEQDDTEGVSVKINSLDSRLRLKSCEDDLDTFWSPGSRKLGRVTVQVLCAHPHPWRIHVQATVSLEGSVWVLAKGVQRGEVLTRSHLKEEIVTVGGSNSSYRNVVDPVVNLQPWLGFEFSQRARSGSVLTEAMLAPATVINKGEAVLITYETAGLQLQTKGVALSDGAKGRFVRVKNTSSGNTIDAVVIDRGLVSLLQ